MDNTLFQIEASLSPRMQWMKKFRITTCHREKEKSDLRWIAQSKLFFAHGPTEDDALVNLAKRMGIMLWSEILWKTGEI